jgi:hypothetical protein
LTLLHLELVLELEHKKVVQHAPTNDHGVERHRMGVTSPEENFASTAA